MAHHIAVTLWVVGVFDIPRIGRSGVFFPRPDKNPINEDQWEFSFPIYVLSSHFTVTVA